LIESKLSIYVVVVEGGLSGTEVPQSKNCPLVCPKTPCQGYSSESNALLARPVDLCVSRSVGVEGKYGEKFLSISVEAFDMVTPPCDPGN